MTKKKLNEWFNSLDLKSLMRMFICPAGRDANDFIDDCDECWQKMSVQEKKDFYAHFAGLA